jgi:hypothetical protein
MMPLAGKQTRSVSTRPPLFLKKITKEILGRIQDVNVRILESSFRFVAVPAVHRPALCRFERDLALLTAF